MANFYEDNKDLKFHLSHPLMEKIVNLKERNFRDKEKYDYAPLDFEDTMDSYDKIMDIVGEISGFRFNNAGDKLKILDVSSWGDLNLGDNNGYFYGCENLDVSDDDDLDLTGTTTFYNMFRKCFFGDNRQFIFLLS